MYVKYRCLFCRSFMYVHGKSKARRRRGDLYTGYKKCEKSKKTHMLFYYIDITNTTRVSVLVTLS